MPPKSDKPLMNELLSDESTRGIELAVTPVVFGGIGWSLDRWLGTGPWIAVALVVFALVGTVAKMWFAYDVEMRTLESTSRWARRSRPDTSAPAGDVDLWADRKAPSA